MEEKIFGMDSAYKEALSRPNTNMLISTNLVVEMVNRIDAIASHAENMASATAWGIGALPKESFIAKQMVEVLKDYNNRNP